MLVFDIEIEKAIPNRKGARIQGIEYCEGWGDHKNMGISVIGGIDADGRSRVFLKDNFDAFIELVEKGETFVSFNGVNFDNKVINAVLGVSIPEENHIDLLRLIWIAEGLNPDTFSRAHGGYGLNAVVEANIPHLSKTENGALAPVLWQRGQYGKVIDYCLNDVYMTYALYNLIKERGCIINPKYPYKMIEIAL